MDSVTEAGNSADPPRVLRASVGLWCALAVVLLLQAALAWGGWDLLQQRLIEQRAATSVQAGSAARTLLLVNSGIAVVLAAGYAGLAWLMRQRRPWARLAVTGLAILHLALMLVTASLSAQNIIMLLLAVAAWACCWRRSSSEWLTGEHD